ncbi:MAG: hypothetical protein V8T38_04595 [Oscillospiraceae bacterium]
MQKNKKIPGRPVKKGGLSRSGIMLIVLSVALIAVVTALIILLNVRGGEESKPEETDSGGDDACARAYGRTHRGTTGQRC